ncbi:MAG TPA: hypothetical protein VGK32_03950 [Vicinamibacterales bacterium]
MKRIEALIVALTLGAGSLASSPARAQTRPAWGRIALFGNSSSTTQAGGQSNTFNELIANVTFESASGDEVGYEYRGDMRLSGYPGSTDRTRRASVYDLYACIRLRDGSVGVRFGQMWLNELGGLGSVGGAMVEVRQRSQPGRGRWRASLFGGFEPNILDVGYVSQVRKFGGLVAYDGLGARRHVVGFVHVRDSGMTERSVLVFTNFLPIDKRVFVYQAAEYDVRGPGVTGAGSLTYFFTNGRYAPNDRIEFQGLFHRGRSIDSRSLVRDQLDGRPIDPRALEGLRFESVSGRVTVRLARNVRVFGGYGQDRNNRDDAVAGRLNYGLFASNVGGIGIDINASDSRINRGTSGSYDSWYVSVGRTFGGHVYLSADYGSSLSVFRFTGSDGFVIETRPHSRRLAFSGLFNLTHRLSLLATAERVDDGTSVQTRVMSGMTCRF